MNLSFGAFIPIVVISFNRDIRATSLTTMVRIPQIDIIMEVTPVIPFENTLPYERIGADFYIQECPFCRGENVLLKWSPKDKEDTRSGTKKRLVLPCCNESFMIVDMDDDYMLADVPIRII
jgi:hypothetical protein